MYASVLVGLNRPETDKLFDYRIPEGVAVCIGARVIVPFGSRNKKTEGYVLSFSKKTEVPQDKIKEILEVTNEGEPILTPVLLDLAKWMQERYFCTLNQCLQAILPPGLRSKSRWTVTVGAVTAEIKLTPKEKALLALFGTRESLPLEEVQDALGENCLVFLRRAETKGLLKLRQEIYRSAYQKEKRLYSLCLDHPLLKETRQRAERDKRLLGQGRILEYLENGREATAAEMKEALGVTDSPIQTLLKKGILRERRQAEKHPTADTEKIERTKPFPPTAEQAAALSALRRELAREEKRPVLLHGVTGSGKTEVYMQLIAEVLAQGRQAIVLVPEIALTPQLASRFLSRFGDAVSVTHSRLSMGERVEQWRRARAGEISVVIGPRSALFLPFPDVGAIIMDEAHESSYVSDITPKYDTKEVAAEAAKRYGALFLMGTATPDVCSYYKACQGKFLLLKLKERTGGGVLPQVFITDMRRELREGNRSAFGRELQAEIHKNLEKGEQTMLFLNRRGYATFVSCRSCGHVMKCPECDITYTYHAKEHALLCHYCGRKAPLPRLCPACGSKYIRYFGTGTQKIEEEAKELFPEARILRMDLDTMLTKHSHERILAAFAAGEADILIGTQMIAKGHDYPNVTLVGIMAADLSLNLNSFTAAETAFRLMVQAAGRAGRRDDRGRVLLQTYQPQHYAVQCAARQDYQSFYEEELLVRQMMGEPPFSAFFRILLTGAKKEETEQAAQELAKRLAEADSEGIAAILGPTPAALPKFRGAYRYQLIVKAAEEEPLRQLVVPVVQCMKKESGGRVRLQLSLNPANLV